jgi:hypothetical protein
MKGLFTTIITGFAAVAALMFAAHSFAQGPDRDWEQEMAKGGKGMAVFLKYHPTDGESHGGQVRKNVTGEVG